MIFSPVADEDVESSADLQEICFPANGFAHRAFAGKEGRTEVVRRTSWIHWMDPELEAESFLSGVLFLGVGHERENRRFALGSIVVFEVNDFHGEQRLSEMNANAIFVVC